MLDTVLDVAKSLEGTYALVVTSTKQPGTIVAGRMMSPLVLGVGEGEVFLASDSAAILEYTNKMIFLENGDFVEINDGNFTLYDVEKNVITRDIQIIDWEVSEAEKAGHDHFMYKEILEQAEVIERTITGRIEKNSTEIPIHLDKALADLLLSWYQSGYQAGRYHALREVNGGTNNNMNSSYHQ